MPAASHRGGRPCQNHRRVVEGIVCRFWARSRRRDLPAEFGLWRSAWKRHRRFSGDGILDRIYAEILADADSAGQVDWALSVDSTINRAHQHATNLLRSTDGLVELQESEPGTVCLLHRPLARWFEHEDPPPRRRAGARADRARGRRTDRRGLHVPDPDRPSARCSPRSGPSLPRPGPCTRRQGVLLPGDPHSTYASAASSPSSRSLRGRKATARAGNPRRGRPVGYDVEDYKGRNVVE